jgi:hypothetical protein
VAQGEADVVEPFEQTPTGVVIDGERHHSSAIRRGVPDLARLQVHRHSRAGVRLDGVPQALHVGLGHLGGEQTTLSGVAAEDVGKAGSNDDAKAMVLQGPHRVLPG